MIGDVDKFYFMFYFWGYISVFLVYIGLSYFFFVLEIYIVVMIYEDLDIILVVEGFDKGDFEFGDEKKMGEKEVVSFV